MDRAQRAPRIRFSALLLPLIGLIIGALLAAASISLPGTALAAGNTLRISPATTTVAKVGNSFTVHVIQNASVATSGAQATVTFDQTKLQITSVAKGAGYAGAALFLGAGASDITAANASGSLKTVAAAYLAGTGTTKTGDQDFLDIVFKATACGSSTLGLPVGPADAVLTDANGASLTVTTTGGMVGLACPTPSPTPKPSPSPTPVPTPTPTASPKPSASPTPSASASASPSAKPSATPTAAPTATPTAVPSATPTPTGTVEPTSEPTATPTGSVLAATATPRTTPPVTSTADGPTNGSSPEGVIIGLGLLFITAIALAEATPRRRSRRGRTGR